MIIIIKLKKSIIHDYDYDYKLNGKTSLGQNTHSPGQISHIIWPNKKIFTWPNKKSSDGPKINTHFAKIEFP